MTILDTRETKYEPSLGTIHAAMDRAGIDVVPVKPSAMSFLTTMRLATAVKHCQDPEAVIVVDSYRDAIAASSVATIGRRIPIIYCVRCNNSEEVPAGVAHEVARSVDCWVFTSKRAQEAYRAISGLEMKRSEVIGHAANQEMVNAEIPESQHPAPLSLTWMGPITHTEPLVSAIQAAAAMARGTWRFRIFGSGPAGRVMPAVKAARRYGDIDIEWAGEEYEWPEVLATTDMMVQKAWDTDSYESAAMSHGIPIVDPDADMEGTINAMNACAADPEALKRMAQEARNSYMTEFSLSSHVEQWRKLLNSL